MLAYVRLLKILTGLKDLTSRAHPGVASKDNQRAWLIYYVHSSSNSSNNLVLGNLGFSPPILLSHIHNGVTSFVLGSGPGYAFSARGIFFAIFDLEVAGSRPTNRLLALLQKGLVVAAAEIRHPGLKFVSVSPVSPGDGRRCPPSPQTLKRISTLSES